MNRLLTEKMLALWARGVITTEEAASQVVYDLAFDKEFDKSFPALVQSFPTPVKDELFGMLKRIRDGGFQWTPFLIGGRSPPADPGRLREIYQLLGLA